MRSTEGYLDYDPAPLPLDVGETRRWPRRHVFERRDVQAINAALAAQRPLLLRGKPGTGKSQLALAAAVGLGRAFVSVVVDSRTEARDLLWSFDAVGRLADAQIGSFEQLVAAKIEGNVAKADDEASVDRTTIRELLHRRNYTRPEALWWAFDWKGAQEQADVAKSSAPAERSGCDPDKGVVVLLDEVDKADSSVPNGLLGVLGDGEFSVPHVGTIRCEGVPPLVVITTNEERALPDAFLRRCAVHELTLEGEEKELIERLSGLGRAHFVEVENAAWFTPSNDMLKEAAKMLLKDRELCLREGLSPPGVAEYLDLLRVALARSASEQEIKKHLDSARHFMFRKHPGLPGI